MDDVAIRVDHVSKAFKLPHEKHTSIKGALIGKLQGGGRSFETQQVLKDVSFEIKKGEFFGIVGRNGSGKSTLLKMLAGIYTPTKGDITVNGKLTPFIELGVGFNPELTGRENVFLNGALLGFNRSEMTAMYDDIVAFAELDRFMDQKLKNYSSGMQVRLAFSIAIRAQSDILVLDEVLAVGDAIFQQKCFDYFKELKGQGKTLVLVSHDAGALQKYCDKGILLEDGAIRTKGKIRKVLNNYQDVLLVKEEHVEEKASKQKLWGSGSVTISAVKVTNDKGAPQKIFTDTDPSIEVSVEFLARESVDSPIYGIIITDPSNVQLFASNTEWYEAKTTNLSQGQKQEISWSIPNIFNTGTYRVSPAVANSTGTIMYEWVDDAIEFKVRKRLQSSAQANVAHQLIVHAQKNKET